MRSSGGEALNSDHADQEDLVMPPLVFVRGRREILKLYLTAVQHQDIKASIIPIYHTDDAKKVAELVQAYAAWEDSRHDNPSTSRPTRAEELLGCQREAVTYQVGESMSALVLTAPDDPKKGPTDSKVFYGRGLRPFGR